MNNINILKQKTVSELKKIADKYKITYAKTIKKDEIIKLILKEEKINETVNVKKEEFSQSSTSNINQPQNFSGTKNIDENINLPHAYGKNKMVLMIRDPYWGFVYWEVTESLIREHNLNWNDSDKFLRIYDISDSDSCDKPSSIFDIKINNTSNNWYINLLKANRKFVVDLGYFKENKFITLLRSNPASTPRDGVSDQIDQEWMMTDDQFRLILNASGANAMFQQIGSAELMKFLASNIEESLSSGGASLSSPIGSYGNK